MSAAAAPPVVLADVWARCKISGPQYGISAPLLAALAWKESSFYQYAFNPEPRYRYFVDLHTWAPFRRLTAEEIASKVPPPDFPSLYGDRDQEWWLQQASIGVAQVMGAVAREHGFRGKSLLELVKLDTNLDLAAKHLARQIARWGSTEAGLSAYNAGSPSQKNEKTYVEPILRMTETIRSGVE